MAAFDNNGLENLQLTRFDGCVDCDGRKADYVVSHADSRRVVVELKGKNVEEAEEQIANTVVQMRAGGIESAQIVALVVCSRSPLATSSIQRMSGRLKKQGIARLKVKSREWRGEFSELFA